MKKMFLCLTVVFFSSSTFSGQWFAVDGGVIEVKLNTSEVENSLWKYVSSKSNKKFASKELYVFQYKAITKDTLKIMGSCDVQKEADLNKAFYMVFDGGSCYFQIKYNLKTGMFSELSVNGEA
ncbi:hypothetical protein [Shewanella sp. Isolate7]|uniref:hypothetical protein n=1 Tax=Shewanella sp. Isolate7 TaxID=2908528 RepID=UPI001EFC8935|nr:hypothetical protein [Shewanella sp. Isolate7]MCG9722359.1 hypothetical protein [Shewanella sp. Isolate7]